VFPTDSTLQYHKSNTPALIKSLLASGIIQAKKPKSQRQEGAIFGLIPPGEEMSRTRSVHLSTHFPRSPPTRTLQE
jgi:hypothetical protein